MNTRNSRKELKAAYDATFGDFAASTANTNETVAKRALTNCAICRRELSDADSVALGIGPVCRKKAGYHYLDGDARKAANEVLQRVSYAASFENDWTDQLAVAADELQLLAANYPAGDDNYEGLTRLAGSMVEAFAAVVIKLDDNAVFVKTNRYADGSNDFYQEARTFVGYKWTGKRHSFPRGALDAVKHLVAKHFPGKAVALAGYYWSAPATHDQDVIDTHRNVPAPPKPSIAIPKGSKVQHAQYGEGVVFWCGPDKYNDDRYRAGVKFSTRKGFLDTSELEVIEAAQEVETITVTERKSKRVIEGCRWFKSGDEWAIGVPVPVLDDEPEVQEGDLLKVYSRKHGRHAMIPAGEVIGARVDYYDNRYLLVRPER